MEKGRKCGQISQFIKVNTRWGRNMGKGNLFGMMGTIILDNLRIIWFKVKENIYGRMVEDLLVVGRIIKWMEKEYRYRI